MPDLIIGGAGLFGLTIAERAANAGYQVLIVEKRNHIGGNVSSHIDEKTGVEVHTYGSHIFHTNNEVVWDYVNRFTEFVPYQHRVRTTVKDGRVIPLPFGLATYSALYGERFTPSKMRQFVDLFMSEYGNTTVKNLANVAVSSIGPYAYELLVKGYTQKQWGKDPQELPAETIKRLPVRFTWDDGYFTDKYQGLPKDGYQAWLEKMADHPNIEIKLEEDVLAVWDKKTPLLFTGPIDLFFNYEFGELGWRTVDLVEEHPTVEDYQGCPVMNYGDADVPYTRIHEYRHYRPDLADNYNGTVIHKEYSRDAEKGEIGAYPINTEADKEMLKRYREAANNLDNVWLGGRLGTYKYLDMHMAIASALTMWSNDIQPHLEKTENK